MNRRLLIGFAALLATCGTPSEGLTPAEGRIVERIREVRELRHAAAWPGLADADYDTPLLYYTDSVCYAVNPTDRFRTEFGARRVFSDADLEIYKVNLPDSQPFHMETQMNFTDSTAYNARIPLLRCSSPELTVRTVSDVTTDSVWLPMVLHEYAHGFQFRQPGVAATFAREMISVPESTLKDLHLRYDWLGHAVAAENDLLLAAIEAEASAARDSCIRRFRELRTARKQRMAAELGDSVVRAEAIYESMEGMARYVEACAGFRLGSYTEADDWLWRTDRSGYFFATGYNLVRLLDQCGADKSQFFSPELPPLETFLEPATSEH